ncbi:hypothetical protein [Paraburkholderia terrae]|uniref:hypothetical protein n=1 Tax=Paraburkholderia terrae TaxID=311230 RepID=UPI0020BEA63A|nr:hypothetical protein [Paraburkholderia terrae]
MANTVTRMPAQEQKNKPLAQQTPPRECQRKNQNTKRQRMKHERQKADASAKHSEPPSVADKKPNPLRHPTAQPRRATSTNPVLRRGRLPHFTRKRTRLPHKTENQNPDPDQPLTEKKAPAEAQICAKSPHNAPQQNNKHSPTLAVICTNPDSDT